MIQPQIDTSSLSAATDESLMKAITHRHQVALRTLYERYGKTLKAVVTRVVHEETGGERCFAGNFSPDLEGGGELSPKAGRPLGWVVTLARRRAIDRLRRRQAYCRAKERFESHVEHQPESWAKKSDQR